MKEAKDILLKASDLVSGDRNQMHGDIEKTFGDIAIMWNAYLNIVDGKELEACDVAQMMALLKMARSKNGSHNQDDYIDQCGYSGIAGQLASGA